jgi:acyl carrier protein
MPTDKIRIFVINEIASLTGRDIASIADETPLIGGDSGVKSRTMVELMLACEDFLEAEFGAELNWYSDSALSAERSGLRTVGSLVALMAERAGAADD